MEIQQKEKESLAAYMNHFKREAKRCNFTNSAATIRIFVKGFKNTHTLATQVYEKGPQTLADAISGVDRLQAAQQLTPDPPLDTITGTDTDTADQGHSPDPTDIEAIVIMTPTEVIPGHIIETLEATIGVLHDAIFAMTHHIKGHPLIGILQLTQKIAEDPDYAQHISQVRKSCISLHPILAALQ